MVDFPSFVARTKNTLRPDTLIFDVEYVEKTAEKYGKNNPLINWMLSKGNALDHETGAFEAGTGSSYSLKKMGLAVGEFERGQQEPSSIEDINMLHALVNDLLVGKGLYPSIPAAYFDLMRLQGAKNRADRSL
jgi:hypothetical protein